ncbi:MAG: nicotinate-nucleotide adenylyltransferase [Nitrospinota bacterium]|nr:MAG: nicotinate-nucleotide adenylyltransferase [Nitrospinota bacterium]
MKIGIFGGTFDPIHLGHLLVAQEVLIALSLDQILFIPVRIPPHKPAQNITPAHHRLAMVKMAIASNPRFHYSEIELQREGKSYTIDTIIGLRRTFPAETEFFLLIGEDQLNAIDTWKDYRKIFELVPVVVFTRAGTVKRREVTHLGLTYTSLRVLNIEISGTLIRERIRQGQPIKYLVPEEVERYILENRLYT